MSSFSFNSQRNSPFRRPERSQSTLRASTPTKDDSSRPTTPSRLSPTKDDSPRPTTPSRLSPSKLDTASSPFRRSGSALSNNNNDAADAPPSPSFFRRSNSSLLSPSTSPAKVPETPTSPTPAPATEQDSTSNTNPPNRVLDSPFLRKRSSVASPEPSSPAAPTPTPAFLTTRPAMPRMPTNATITTNATTIRPSSPQYARNDGGGGGHYNSGRSYGQGNRMTADALTHLPPALLHSIRESFAVLDRRSTGTIGVEDIAAALADVGLERPSARDFFNGSSGSMNLANYLQQMSALLSPLSRSDELMAAFAAFDDGDDGVVDLGDLLDAVTGPDGESGVRGLSRGEVERVVGGFSGRRALGGRRGVGREEVFRYREFVGSLYGGGGREEGEGVV